MEKEMLQNKAETISDEAAQDEVSQDEVSSDEVSSDEVSSDDMRINELLRYFKNSDPFYETENFPRIVERVRYFKVKKEGVTIMCEIADRIRREGREEGRQEGEIIGRVKDILELLADIGEVPQRIVTRIRQETDTEQLGRWHKCAARASSFAEFESKAGLL